MKGTGGQGTAPRREERIDKGEIETWWSGAPEKRGSHLGKREFRT